MKKFIFIVILVLFMNKQAFARVRVVTTTFMLSSIVKQIGGVYVDTAYLIPVGSNPHIFSPRPKSLMKLEKADIFIGVGFGFEFWLASIRDFLKNKDVVFLSNFYKNPIDKTVIGVSVIANPHIWLDLNFMGSKAVYIIAKKLCAFDAQHCKFFLKNAHTLSNRIEQIRNMYIKTMSYYKNCCFVDIKPAFEYLLKSIGTRSCCVLIKKGNEEPKIGDIKKAINSCRCPHGVVLYVTNSQLAKMIAEKLHYSIVDLHPLGDKKLDTYPKLMLYNLHKLQKILE